MTFTELKRANGLGDQKRPVPGQPLLVRVRAGVDDPDLPNLATAPVALPRAVKAAKAKVTARKGRHVQVRRARAAGSARKAAHENVMRKGGTALKQLGTSRGTRTRLVAQHKMRASAKARILATHRR